MKSSESPADLQCRDLIDVTILEPEMQAFAIHGAQHKSPLVIHFPPDLRAAELFCVVVCMLKGPSRSAMASTGGKQHASEKNRWLSAWRDGPSLGSMIATTIGSVVGMILQIIRS